MAVSFAQLLANGAGKLFNLLLRGSDIDDGTSWILLSDNWFMHLSPFSARLENEKAVNGFESSIDGQCTPARIAC
jgi:hypothetical protein